MDSMFGNFAFVARGLLRFACIDGARRLGEIAGMPVAQVSIPCRRELRPLEKGEIEAKLRNFRSKSTFLLSTESMLTKVGFELTIPFHPF